MSSEEIVTFLVTPTRLVLTQNTQIPRRSIALEQFQIYIFVLLIIMLLGNERSQFYHK